MQENAHHQVLIGFKLLHLIDWEGVQSFLDHSLGEVLSKTSAVLI